MATYNYTQYFNTGGTTNYVKYNITPEFDPSMLIEGERTFTISGTIYNNTGAFSRITVPTTAFVDELPLFDIAKTIKKSTATTFSATTTLTLATQLRMLLSAVHLSYKRYMPSKTISATGTVTGCNSSLGIETDIYDLNALGLQAGDRLIVGGQIPEYSTGLKDMHYMFQTSDTVYSDGETNVDLVGTPHRIGSAASDAEYVTIPEGAAFMFVSQRAASRGYGIVNPSDAHHGRRLSIQFILDNLAAFTLSEDGQAYTFLTHRVGPSVPALSAAPDDLRIISTTTPLARYGSYVQGQSIPHFLFEAAPDSLDETASVESFALTVSRGSQVLWSGTSDAGGEFTLPEFDTYTAEALPITYSCTATDNYGTVSAPATGTLSVLPYVDPSISQIGSLDIVERYLKRAGPEVGQIIREISDDGIYAWYNFISRVTAMPATLENLNPWSLHVEYRAHTDDDSNPWTAIAPQLLSGENGGENTRANYWLDRLELTTFNELIRYDFRLALTDWFQTVYYYTGIDKAGGYLNVEKYGTAVGMRTTANSENKKFECAYPAYFYGGIAVGGSMTVEPGETMTFTDGAFNGYATNSTKTIYLTIPIYKSLEKITSVTCTQLIANISNAGGYGLSSGYVEGGKNYTSLISSIAIIRESNSLFMTITRSSAFDLTNNTNVQCRMPGCSATFVFE